MNNSYSLNKSPKIAKRLLVLLDMIVVVLTLALSVSALQRHFWTIGLWRPLASCLAHRPLHRHWFGFVAFPLKHCNTGDRWLICECSAKAVWGEVGLRRRSSPPAMRVVWISRLQASLWGQRVKFSESGGGVYNRHEIGLRPPAATKRVSHVQTKQQQAELPDGGWHRSWTLTFIRSTTKSVSRVQQLISCNFKICSYWGGTLRQH